MQDLVRQAKETIGKIGERSKQVVKTLNAIQKALDKGDLLKAGKLIDNPALAKNLNELYADSVYEGLKTQLEKKIGRLRIEFDKRFLDICSQIDLSGVVGDSMSGFRIRGVLRLKISFQKNSAEIRTDTCRRKVKSLDPGKLAEEAKQDVERLFYRPFDPRAFLLELYQAYSQLSSQTKKTVLLRDVHRTLWVQKQKADFFAESNASKMASYPVDEFSIDLSKLLESKVSQLENGYGLRLLLGSGGINVYAPDGNFNAYKFIEFQLGG